MRLSQFRNSRHMYVRIAFASLLVGGLIAPGSVNAAAPVPETLRQHLERRIDVIQHRESTIKAFIDTDFPGARQRASELKEANGSGLLYGKVVAVKDNIQVAGFRTTAGAAALVANPIVTEHRGDAPVVSSLRSSGAIVIGTTNMDTWARGVRGLSEVRGQTANPLDSSRNAGGSSAGSAAAIAAGMVDVAIGTDTCGSIRYPASSVGIYGLRPTWGTVSLDGVVPLAPGQDVVGPMAANIADLRATWSAMLGRPDLKPVNDRRPTRRLGVMRGGGTIDRRWIAQAKRAGFVIVDAGDVPSTDGTNLVELQFPIAKRAYLLFRSGSASMSWITANGLIGTKAEQKLQMDILKKRKELHEELEERLTRFDVDAFIQPVTTALPALLGEKQLSGNCMVAAGSGLPALATPGIPSGNSKLSIGVELIGRANDEATLMNAAERIGSQ